MKLRYTPTSPYVRKVTVTAFETGTHDRIERIASDPWSPESDIGQTNPMGKVPTLVTDDGMALFDSPVICEYLDTVGDQPKLYPSETNARFKALALAATGDGMLDAGVLLLIETMRRPEELRWDWWIERQRNVVLRCMDVADAAADGMATDGPITIGEVAIGCALGWIDFRFPDFGWRNDRPALADWFDKIMARPSFEQTVPKAPS